MSAERIVSLLPASTEILHALGAGDRLVGRSHECDHPVSVQELPVCTSPRIDMSGSSRETDDQVRHLIRQGSSVYEVDPAVLRDLEPDMILTQSQCEVCAVDTDTVHRAIKEGLEGDPTVLELRASSYMGILDDIRTVGNGIGKSAHGEKLVQEIEYHRQWFREEVIGLEEPTVASIEWIDPLMAGGNWIPEIISSVGGHSLFGIGGEHSPFIQRDELLEADPGIILVMPCGYDLKKTREEMKALTEWSQWKELSAVKNGQVFLLEGNQYFNRPGPRIKESMRILAEVLHPDRFDPEMKGAGWEFL
ncbi:MAG: cobalamin-binding protein [Flavobacteriales bacterium]